jgi:actin-like ATPase involved in cell morphogenesis
MGYHLGVDLGTTFSAAAAMSAGPPTMIGLGNRSFQIPSVLYFLPDGGVLVGEAAEHRSGSDPSRTVREFKRRIGDPVPILVAGRPFSAQALSGRLLRWVVDKSAEQMGERPVDITLTYPANWGHFKIDLLRQVAMLADVDSVRACSEPEAAALQYASRSKVNVGDRIAVYDLGGGTFDVCVLEKTETGFQVPGRPEGIEHLGGIDFDEAIFQRVIGQLPPDVIEAAIDDATQMPALARLRRDCVEAKEALSTDVDAVIPVGLAGARTSVRLTRSEFEDIIRPALEDTVGATRRALRSANTEAAQLTAIVLVGGSSRIPLVAEMLGSEFRRPIAVDTHPKNDVAMGAARAGALQDAGIVLTAPSRRRASGAVPLPSRSVQAPDLVPSPGSGPAPDESSAPDLAPAPDAFPAPDESPTPGSAAATIALGSAEENRWVPPDEPVRAEALVQPQGASTDTPSNSDRGVEPARAAEARSVSTRSRWLVIAAGVGVVLAAGLAALIVILSQGGGESGQATIKAATTEVASSTASQVLATSSPATTATRATTASPTTTSADASSASVQSTALAGPTQLQVSSTEPWTDTGFACAPGRSLDISATGTVLHNKDDPASAVGPDGLTEPAFRQYNVPGLPDVNTVALIGSLDQAQPYFLVGSATTLVCPAAGELFLGVNDAGLANNSGSFDVTISQRTG